MVETLPQMVTLAGIRYKVIMAEGDTIIFSQRSGFPGVYARLVFYRRCGCWQVEINTSNGSVPVSHVMEAMKHLDVWFGGNFKCPRGENAL